MSRPLHPSNPSHVQAVCAVDGCRHRTGDRDYLCACCRQRAWLFGELGQPPIVITFGFTFGPERSA